jgi:hypothetical protein
MHRKDGSLQDTLLAKVRFTCIVKKLSTAETEGSSARLQLLETRTADYPLIGELQQTGTEFTHRWKKDKFGKL